MPLMGEGRTGADERLTLRQAAARLGVPESAIRKRVERGTLRSDLGVDGRRYVYLDTVADTGEDASATHERDAHISQLRDEIAYLREENRRKDHLLAAALERIPPAIEAPQETRESPETAADAVAKGGARETPFTDEERPQEAAQPRSWWAWWRRVFGG